MNITTLLKVINDMLSEGTITGETKIYNCDHELLENFPVTEEIKIGDNDSEVVVIIDPQTV